MATLAATRSAQRKLLDFFAFDPGEVRPTLLLTLYLLLAIASVITMKATSNSLFLTRFSARQLPFVYVAIAALAGFVVSFYIKLSVRLSQHRLLIYTQMFFASHLVLFWWLLRLQFHFLPALIYVWTGVYAVIIPSQVWTLANHTFTTRQARRLFAVVGSGGILGAALGGMFSSVMARWVGTPNLLLACVGFLFACSGIVAYLWRTSRALAPSKSKEPRPSNLAESMRTVLGSRYLTLITLLLVLSAVVNNLVDYQFKYIVRREISNADDLTAFFASFTSYMACFGFLMQLILTSRVMRWFGLNFAIFVLPISMLLGSTILLFSAHLMAAALLKGFDQAFRHSIDRSSTELLYVPLSAQLKQQAKSFIDMVASRWADGLGGVLLILLASVWHLSVQEISWVNIGIIAPWLALAWMVRREYVNALRSSIERKDISAEALLIQMAGSSEEITTVLSSSDERAVETGLGLLQYGQGNVAYAHLASLLTHISPTIRRKAMGIVLAKNVPGCSDEVHRFLYLDDHVDSLWQALDYLERQNGSRFRSTLDELLESPYPVLRGTAAARVLALDSQERGKAYQVFNTFVGKAQELDTNVRFQAAQLLGLVPPDLGCQSALSTFLADPDPRVVRAAALSAGRTRQQNLFPRLIELAGERELKTEARQALALFGPEILPALNQTLLDPQLPLRVRRNLPRVFSSIGGQQAADYLVSSLAQPDLNLQYQALRALSRIRLKQSTVRFDSERVTPLVIQELLRYYKYLSLLQGVPQNGLRPGTAFLRRALAEQLNRRLEVIFRLIGLLYPPKDIFDAYYGISSGRRDLRANALELLDSTLLNPVRSMLLPIIEDRGVERIIEHARTQFGIRPGGYQESIRALLAEPDTWLKSCAIYAAADQGLREIEPMLEPMLATGDPLLLETARAARDRLRGDSQKAASPGATWKP